MATKKEIMKYLNLPWSYTVEPEEDYFVVYVNELPGVCTDGASVAEAMEEVKDAIYAAIELYLDQKKEIPLPIDKSKYKGQIPYRTTSETHYELAKLASRKHISVNKLIDGLIVEALKKETFRRASL